MHTHEEVIHRFYTAFQQMDAEAMSRCYHPEASFSDPVFDLKTKEEVVAMWSMLCSRASDLEVTYFDVMADDKKGTATWVAKYSFSSKKRKVVNSIEANFEFKEGLILKHKDSFNFWKWSQQALGMPGHLMGWSPFLKNRVKRQAMGNLKSYQQRSGKAD